jgi:hypothetical protein
MVIRLISVSDRIDLVDFERHLSAVLGWSDQMGYILRAHGQEFNSFRRKTRAHALHEFKLHRQEKFLYVSDTLHLWEWDVQVLDIEDGAEKDIPVCLGGRGAAPPEFCGGPTGYRLMLKRQREGRAMLSPEIVEAGIQLLNQSSPDTPSSRWEQLRTAVDDCLVSLDRHHRNPQRLG